MKLVEARVKMFKHVLDSGAVAIEADVTCLVGKNESGKTAFLQALQSLKPARPTIKVSSARHYPAWLEKKHRRTADLEAFEYVSACFELSDGDVAKLETRFGPGILLKRSFTLSKRYNGQRLLDCEQNDNAALAKIIAAGSDGFADRHSTPASLADLDALIVTLEESGRDEVDGKDANLLSAARTSLLGNAETIALAVIGALDALTPKFFYFAEYSNLPGTIKIRELLEAKRSELADDKLTALSLLELAGAENDYLLEHDYETRKRELENVANSITEDILEYWTTNQQIRVEIDVTQRTVETQKAVQNPHHPHQQIMVPQQSTVLDELRIRLRDDRHSLSLPFDERSTGFRWFFSFLAAFSAYETADESVIILLDEPGLGLHARAQRDFMKFIDERLGRARQVIYTTHSPFLVQPTHIERVRLVEDKGKETGSVITADVLSTDADTLFPLQAALGYDIAQHLFIAPHNLIVEGTSDFTYLAVMSRHLAELDREALRGEWSVVPVGGADMVPTFVALLGHHLDVTVLVDSQKAGHQRLDRIAEQGLLDKKRIITIGTVLSRKLADVEDLFATDDYVRLYNAAFGAKVKASDLKGTDQVLLRVERAVGGRFDHGKPADVLLRRRDEFLPTMGTESLDRFEALFRTINATLPR